MFAHTIPNPIPTTTTTATTNAASLLLSLILACATDTDRRNGAVAVPNPGAQDPTARAAAQHYLRDLARIALRVPATVTFWAAMTVAGQNVLGEWPIARAQQLIAPAATLSRAHELQAQGQRQSAEDLLTQAVATAFEQALATQVAAANSAPTTSATTTANDERPLVRWARPPPTTDLHHTPDYMLISVPPRHDALGTGAGVFATTNRLHHDHLTAAAVARVRQYFAAVQAPTAAAPALSRSTSTFTLSRSSPSSSSTSSAATSAVESPLALGATVGDADAELTEAQARARGEAIWRMATSGSGGVAASATSGRGAASARPTLAASARNVQGMAASVEGAATTGGHGQVDADGDVTMGEVDM